MDKSFSVSTSQESQFIDITAQVQKLISESGVTNGIAVVFVAHTTAAVTINENADPDVRHDFLVYLDSLVPQRPDFRHNEGNSPAHIKASIFGSSVTVIVANGHLHLGTWQGIYLCEFDGPRTRKVCVSVIAG